MLYLDRTQWTLADKKGPNTIGLPLFIALLLAPVLGATFVLFLPFAGVWLCCAEAWKKVRAGLKSPAQVSIDA